jgi:hypothetical protein
VEAEDSDGAITKVRLVGNSLVVAEAASSPLRFTLANVPAGSYTFKAEAIDDQGAVVESASVTITIAASGSVVSLVGVQPFFTSSPGTLVANIKHHWRERIRFSYHQGLSGFCCTVVSITAPANNSSFTTDRVNVSGIFTESSLQQITVNRVRAFSSGNTFEALNIVLAEEADTITATAQSLW